MREIETIIVGGGPAGSTCATELLAHGRRCLVLERQAMPRPKLCAGWITPKVLSDLGIQPADYPYGMLELRRFRLILGRRHQFVRTIATRQYSVRRIEFDPWLLARSETEVVRHTVRTIRREQDAYVIDDAFRCRYLVGAGGTACPVKKSLFPEDQGRLIITREIEYPCTPRYPVCTVWYPFAGNLGYAWYVPKAGAVNVGFGLAHSSAEKRDLKALWLEFVGLLRRADCIDSDPPGPKGHPYYCGDRRKQLRRDNAWIIGDAAGLATLDLAEGIGPAIESGTLAARDILGIETYSAGKITSTSIGPLIASARPSRSVAELGVWGRFSERIQCFGQSFARRLVMAFPALLPALVRLLPAADVCEPGSSATSAASSEF
jgi:flavin-dependent dehydrogenase